MKQVPCSGAEVAVPDERVEGFDVVFFQPFRIPETVEKVKNGFIQSDSCSLFLNIQKCTLTVRF